MQTDWVIMALSTARATELRSASQCQTSCPLGHQLQLQGQAA